MTIEVKWYDDTETILLETLPPTFKLDDYILMVDEAARLLSTKEHTVHIVFDLSGSRAMPGNVAAGARYAEQKVPPNQGVVVFVRPGSLINIYISIATRLNFKAAENLHTADTVEEAIAIIDREKIKFIQGR